MNKWGESAQDIILNYNMVEGAPWVHNVDIFFRLYEYLETVTVWDESYIDAGGRPTKESWLNAVALAEAFMDDTLCENPFEGLARNPTDVVRYMGGPQGNNTYYIHIGNSWFGE